MSDEERPPSRLSRRTRNWIALYVTGLLVSTYLWWPMIAGWSSTQGGDGQYFHKFIEAGRVSVMHFRELPLWDPYECGGRPLWDNPQALVAAPLMWLNFFVGTSVAMKVWYWLHTAAGFVSMWLFCRKEMRTSRTSTFAAAVAWSTGVFHMHHVAGGHAAFVTFELMPLALLLWRRADENDRAAMGVGLIVALQGLEGGALPLLYFAVLLGAETLTRLWPLARIVRIARAGAIVLGVGIGIGAVRFFPVIDQLRSHTRPLPKDFDHMTASSLLDAFVNGHIGHLAHIPDHTYVWGEYSTYLGWALLLLAIAGIALTWRKNLWMVAILVLGISLMVGYQGRYSPWGILNQHVYPISQMRVPARFNLQTAFLLLAFAASGADRLGAYVARLPFVVRSLGISATSALVVRHAVPLVAVLGAGDSLGTAIELAHMYPTGGADHPKTTKRSPRIYYGGRDSAAPVDQPQQNRGRTFCYEPWAPYEGAAVWDGDVPQGRSLEPAAVVSNVTRTQNTFDLDVQSDGPAKVLLNSTFDLNWRSTIGRPFENNKMLAVEVPAGVHHVHLFYRPRYLGIGAVVSAISIALTIWAFRRTRRPRS